jgi:hypothetical protein
VLLLALLLVLLLVLLLALLLALLRAPLLLLPLVLLFVLLSVARYCRLSLYASYTRSAVIVPARAPAEYIFLNIPC